MKIYITKVEADIFDITTHAQKDINIVGYKFRYLVFAEGSLLELSGEGYIKGEVFDTAFAANKVRESIKKLN